MGINKFNDYFALIFFFCRNEQRKDTQMDDSDVICFSLNFLLSLVSGDIRTIAIETYQKLPQLL